MKLFNKRELIPLWMCFLLLSFGIGFIPLLDKPENISINALIMFNSIGWFIICAFFLFLMLRGLKNES
jgi:hypothetical protein